MARKRPASSSSGPEKKKRATNVMSLDQKVKVLDMLRTGMTQTAVGKHFGVNESTIRSIKKKETEIRQSVSLSFRGTKMENALGLWIENARERNVQLSGEIIRTKASSLYEKIEVEEGSRASTSTETEAGASTEPQAGSSTEPQAGTSKKPEFLAGKGWLDSFLKRFQMRNVRLHGEAASADHEAAETYPAHLQKIIEENGYKPEQIFNMDETGLYWKKMPATTYVMKKELKAPGFKAQNDRVTLVFCGNAAGHMIKPGFIYKAKNPRALKNKNKNCLPVYWMFHPKAWINQVLTADWFHQCFVPETTRYLRDLDLPYKVLLLMDNAGGHAADLTADGVRVEFLPPNTTSLLQPMDQGVIRSFKALYTSSCMQRLVDAMDLTKDFSIKNYWKSFTIASCLSMITKTLQELKKQTVNSSWGKLLPAFVHNDKGFTPAEIQAAAVSNALRLAHLVGGEGFTEITTKDLNDLIDHHENELTDDELIELTRSASEEEDDQDREEPIIRNLTVENLSHLSRMVAALQQEVELQDPNMIRALQFKNGLDGVFRPYSEMLKKLKREREQLPITAFFTPLKKTTPAPAAAEQPAPGAVEQPAPAPAAEPDVEIVEEVEALLEEEEVDELPPFEGFEDE